MGVAKEGYPFILSAAVLALVAYAVGWKGSGLLLGFFALTFLGFFRDPDRVPPDGQGLILSPADGRIVEIREMTEETSGNRATRVSIFLSLFDVHINRSPVQGLVEQVEYRSGEFLAAFKEAASEKNERNMLRIRDAEGRVFGVVQVAGLLARRIVCYVTEGDSLLRAQRFGLIMFGSRVDLFLPQGVELAVIEGQKVKGGRTVIGRLV